MPNASSLPVTATWKLPDGTVVRVDTIPAGQLTGDLLWPGMVLNANGVAIGWPGWRELKQSDFPLKPGVLIYGNQISDTSLPSFAYRHPMTVTFEMNPQETVTVDYPGITPAGCEVPREPNLEITKTASVSSVMPGQTFQYDINVKNVSTQCGGLPGHAVRPDPGEPEGHRNRDRGHTSPALAGLRYHRHRCQWVRRDVELCSCRVRWVCRPRLRRSP